MGEQHLEHLHFVSVSALFLTNKEASLQKMTKLKRETNILSKYELVTHPDNCISRIKVLISPYSLYAHCLPCLACNYIISETSH